MHEELYVRDGSKIRYAMLVFSIILLPFSLLEFAVRNGTPEFSFRLNTPLLSAAVMMFLSFFDGLFKSLMRFLYPYLALLVAEFLRFGTVSIFNREMPFDIYVISAFFMLAAFGFTFILYFIAQGKMRTKIFLICWPVLMAILATVSIIVRILPFGAYDQVTKGVFCIGVSDYIAFLLLNASGLSVAFALRDDKVKKEKKERKSR